MCGNIFDTSEVRLCSYHVSSGDGTVTMDKLADSWLRARKRQISKKTWGLVFEKKLTFYKNSSIYGLLIIIIKKIKAVIRVWNMVVFFCGLQKQESGLLDSCY